VPNVPVQGVHLPDPPGWRARGHIRLAWVGRFDKDKRPQDFVSLIHVLREHFGLPVKGVMVGSRLNGDRSVTLTNYDYITALGWQRDPWRTLAACDLLISTSVREGYGLSPCEAGSVGTPTIAYANHGMVESIAAVGGSLVKARDLWSMAHLVAEWAEMSGSDITEERISIRDKVRLLLENTNQAREVLGLYHGAGVL
jgi:glycosyltransferase involved in cell wall biosynthesis